MRARSSFIISTLLFCLSSNALQNAHAEERKLSVTEANPIKAGLEASVGKTVTVQLSSNQELTGVVEEVGSHAVRLAQLSGKEFYSAVISIDSIVAIIYRAK